jgi:hypothetical protein
MTDNRFVELDRQVRRLGGDYPLQRIAGMQSIPPFSFPLAAADRALIVLIDNGGIDLQLGDVVDRLLALVPGGGMLPSPVRQGIVSALHDKIKSVTRSLLETAELTLNRYTAAQPGLYGDTLVLRDGAATYADLKRTLIAQTNMGKIIDVIVLTHGTDDSISAVDDINGAKIRAVRAEAGKPISIRSVYMMNCVGSSLNQAWIDTGAKTSCGTAKNNYLPEPTCHFFWEKWTAGQSFDSAATSAYRQTVNLMNDTVRSFLVASPIPGTTALADLIDFADFDFVKDSKPIVSGQGTVTISDDGLTFSQGQSRASSLVTTVLSMSDVVAAGIAPSTRTTRTLSDAGLAFIRRFEPVERADPRIGVAELTLTQTVSVPLSQSQVDALISFIVGAGGDAFRASTLLCELNAAHFSAAADEIRKWTKVRQDGQVVDLPALQARRAAEADLFGSAGPGAVAQSMSALAGSMGAVSYRVPGTITPLKQQSPMSCWATVIAMMTEWKEHRSIPPRAAIAPGGQEFLDKFDRDAGLDAASAGRLYQALALVPITSLNPTVDGWDQMLRMYGPLYVDIGFQGFAGTHAIVVTGISGDGSAGGTTITYIDPAYGTIVNRKFSDFLAQYEAPSAVSNWPYVITHWAASLSSGRNLPISQTYTYESPGHPQLAQAQFAIAGIAIADAIQIGLGAVAVAQAGVSASTGTLTLTYDKAQRLLTAQARAEMPGAQAATNNYRRTLFSVGVGKPGFAYATIIIEWQGNAYGEIGTPVIRKDLSDSSDWQHSSAVFAISKLDQIPPAGVDPRAWPVVYHYEGNYDPFGNGYWEFSGEFQIDAFGGIKFNHHQVVDRSAIESANLGKPEEFVRKGPDMIAAVPAIPDEQVKYLHAHAPGGG